MTSLSFFLSFYAHQKHLLANGDFPGGATGKEPACQCRRHKRLGSIPGLGRSLEDGMATHSSKSHEQRSLGGTINGATRVAHNWSDLAFRHTLANAHRRKFSLSEKKVILSNIQHIKCVTIIHFIPSCPNVEQDKIPALTTTTPHCTWGHTQCRRIRK